MIPPYGPLHRRDTTHTRGETDVAQHTPSPDEQTQTTRREFLGLAIGALGFFGGLIVTVPLFAALIGPALRKKTSHWSKVTSVGRLSKGEPTDLTFPDEAVDAYVKETVLHSVWAVKHSSSDVTAFSPICPHLGCHYHWDAQSEHFECPCHGSVFDIDGKVVAGPAPRPLDTLPEKVENGALWVEWERFKLGIHEKVPA
jgi:menaquinol-cytochrome c reductase iron-sulfur subunit